MAMAVMKLGMPKSACYTSFSGRPGDGERKKTTIADMDDHLPKEQNNLQIHVFLYSSIDEQPFPSHDGSSLLFK